MIKRLFRIWLRWTLFKKLSKSCTNWEEGFIWVYNLPVWEWNIGIYCIERTERTYWHDAHYDNIKRKVSVEEAQKLLNFFHK